MNIVVDSATQACTSVAKPERNRGPMARALARDKGTSPSEGPRPRHLQGPPARALARAEIGEADRVVYPKVFEQIEYVVQEYTCDQKCSVWQASVHWLRHFIV